MEIKKSQIGKIRNTFSIHNGSIKNKEGILLYEKIKNTPPPSALLHNAFRLRAARDDGRGQNTCDYDSYPTGNESDYIYCPGFASDTRWRYLAGWGRHVTGD